MQTITQRNEVKMNSFGHSTSSKRLGIHYYPDTEHYTHHDIEQWLPRLSALGFHWLSLQSPRRYAIPEHFIRNLIQAGIKPIINFNFRPESIPDVDTLNLLLKAYADWGVQYINLFDRPNLRSNWSSTAWLQHNLVERFMDVYMPCAEAIIKNDLVPLFPPLEPGGDYWDIAFLRAGLLSMKRRGADKILDRMVLGAYGWVDQRPISWGAGGPERWPSTQPYKSSTDYEDHCGLYIFDWYRAISQSALQKHQPVILMGAGARLTAPVYSQERSEAERNHAEKNLLLMHLLSASEEQTQFESDGIQYEPITADVLACNFWLLAANPNSPYADSAWFKADSTTLPIVEEITRYSSRSYIPEGNTLDTAFEKSPPLSTNSEFPIAHYLLLPRQEWGVTEWHLDIARPYILKYHPTIGFSPAEAAHAAHVLVIDEDDAYPEEMVTEIRNAGCYVERISGDGMQIATQLAGR